jgi:hypothetical protein
MRRYLHGLQSRHAPDAAGRRGLRLPVSRRRAVIEGVAQLRYTGAMKANPKNAAPIKVSVFLPQALHLRATMAAKRGRVSLSAYIADLVETSVKRPTKEPAAV